MNRTELQAAFLREWPVERVERMTLEEYSNRDQDSFTYWLEFKTQQLGSIKGGSSLKFKVYNRKNREAGPPKATWKTDGVHAWHGELGDTPEAAFEKVKPEILNVIRAGQAVDLEAISNNTFFGPALKWKIAAMYNPEAIYPVFKLGLAVRLISFLQPSAPQPSSLMEAQQQLSQWLEPGPAGVQRFHEVMAVASRDERFEGANRELRDDHPDLDLLCPEMGQKWLSVPQEEHWSAALQFCHHLLQGLGAQPDDPRVVIHLRESAGRQRFALIIGGQLLYSLECKHEVEGQCVHRFQIPEAVDALPPPLERCSDFIPSTGSGQMVIAPASAIDVQWRDWALELARAEWNRVSSSPHRREHLAFLQDVISDLDLHWAFIEYVRAPLEVKIKEVYKRLLVVRGIEDELYKWQIFKKFSAGWNLEAKDFGEMQEVMKFDNLMHSTAHSFWKLLWQDPEEARAYFRMILDGDTAIENRLDRAHAESHALLQARRPEWKSSAQDERTLSVIWSALDLAHHAPYKSSFYKAYCQHAGIQPAKPRRAYTHYLQLLDAFIAAQVQSDQVLLSLHAEALGPLAELADPSHHLLAQNMWYKVLDQTWSRMPDKSPQPEVQAQTFEKKGELDLACLEDSFLDEVTQRTILTALEVKKNVILQGPPGTGKTFVARRLAYALMGGKHDDRVTTVQFHQSFSYEDFIQGFRPNEEKGFERRDGVFFRFCERARQRPDLDHFFIIDEINRGNLSKIFGELMMLIEADKRGPEHQVELTYSGEGERFSIPANVYMIGTMNTADRSLAMVDYALRRRFAFFDLQPQFTDRQTGKPNPKLRDHLLNRIGISADLTANILRRMTALNAAIQADPNLGQGFEIGHSYFCDKPAHMSEMEWYELIIAHEVGPQLREFWFDNKQEAEGQIKALRLTS